MLAMNQSSAYITSYYSAVNMQVSMNVHDFRVLITSFRVARFTIAHEINYSI